jgi:predicted nucleic-acid-binding protein
MGSKAVRSGQTLFVAQIVICETVWVLESVYLLDRGQIAPVLSDLLQARHPVVEDAAQVARALDRYVRGPGDLSDYLVAERARAAGFARVATFDKALLSEPDFVEP